MRLTWIDSGVWEEDRKVPGILVSILLRPMPGERLWNFALNIELHYYFKSGMGWCPCGDQVKITQFEVLTDKVLKSTLVCLSKYLGSSHNRLSESSCLEGTDKYMPRCCLSTLIHIQGGMSQAAIKILARCNCP